jgi:hypothetical protein
MKSRYWARLAPLQWCDCVVREMTAGNGGFRAARIPGSRLKWESLLPRDGRPRFGLPRGEILTVHNTLSVRYNRLYKRTVRHQLWV